MKEIWEEILKFNNKYFPRWRSTEPIYYSNAIAGEVGEICNLVKKWHGGGTHRVHGISAIEENIIEECVDAFIYMVLLMESLEYSTIDFEEAFGCKIKELVNRMEENE